jgi:hypothetical protein
VSTLVVYGDTSDGYVNSTSGIDGPDGPSGTYADARNGTGQQLWANTNFNGYYINHLAFTTDWDYVLYAIDEAFLSWDTSSLGSSASVSSVVMQLTSYYPGGGGTQQVRLYDWGTSLTTADFRTGDAFAALTLLCHAADSSFAFSNTVTFTDDAFAANVNKTGSTRVVMAANYLASNTSPDSGGTSGAALYYADNAGTTYDPKLTITYTTDTYQPRPGVASFGGSIGII